MTRREVEWDEDQRAWMLALAEYEDHRCPVCGGDPADCQSPDADPDNPFATWIYRSKLPRVCHVGTAMRKGTKQQKADDPRAFIPQVVKEPRGGRAPRVRDSRGRFTAKA